MTTDEANPNDILTQISPGHVLVIAHNICGITDPALSYKAR